MGCPKCLKIRNPWGKSNGKKGSQIYILILIKGVKLPHKKVCFWVNFALLSRIFFVSVFLTPFNGLFVPTSRNWMSKMFRDSESLGEK